MVCANMWKPNQWYISVLVRYICACTDETVWACKRSESKSSVSSKSQCPISTGDLGCVDLPESETYDSKS